MSNLLTSVARTVASKLMGGLVGFAASLGVAVPADLSESATLALSSLLVLVAQVVYYIAARWAERRWPWLGRVLLWSGRQPLYESPRVVAAAEADARRFGVD